MDESEPPFDYEGVDFLAIRILTSLSGWFGKLAEQERSVQPWFDRFVEFLQLLRM
jgi:hypothetical protein